MLLDAQSEKLLEGDDTQCTVLILDEDKPGMIAFDETVVSVSRRDKVAFLLIKRINGSDGRISCVANTISDVTELPGKRAGVEHVDFTPLKDKLIEFRAGEVEYRLEIEMPECEDKPEVNDGEEEEEVDTVSFAVELSDCKPEGLKLSKKRKCIINIEPIDDDELERADY